MYEKSRKSRPTNSWIASRWRSWINKNCSCDRGRPRILVLLVGWLNPAGL
jgi:hypothetical protein